MQLACLATIQYNTIARPYTVHVSVSTYTPMYVLWIAHALAHGLLVVGVSRAVLQQPAKRFRFWSPRPDVGSYPLGHARRRHGRGHRGKRQRCGAEPPHVHVHVHLHLVLEAEQQALRLLLLMIVLCASPFLASSQTRHFLPVALRGWQVAPMSR